MAGAVLVFPTSSATGATRCRSVTLENDSVVEDVEVFSVSLSSQDPAVLVAASSAVISISDSDGELQFVAFIYDCPVSII